MSNKPTVAIIGRANVGKSSLFNYILRKRISIVHEQEGVTRDIVSLPCTWNSRDFSLIDTAGFMKQEDRANLNAFTLQQQTFQQVDYAIDKADFILFMVDGQTGLIGLDEEILNKLRKKNKEVFLLINKIDNPTIEENSYEFYQLGIKHCFFISCYHKTGLREMLGFLVKRFPKEEPAIESNDEELIIEDEPQKTPNIVLTGKPNTGKSSLTNLLMQQDLMIVNNLAGTTRDAVKFYLKRNNDEFILVDTAGIKNKGKVRDLVELFSMFRSQEAIENADIVLFLIDLEEGVSSADKKIANMIIEMGKPCVLIANKWDLVKNKKPQEMIDDIRNQLKFLHYIDIVLCSVKNNFGVDKIFSKIETIHEQMNKEFSTSLLNQFLKDTLMRHPTPVKNNRRFKIYYGTPVFTKVPFEMILFCNSKAIVKQSFISFLEQALRQAFSIPNIPLKITFKEKLSTDNPFI